MVKSYTVHLLSASKSHVSSCKLLFLYQELFVCLQPVKMLHSAPVLKCWLVCFILKVLCGSVLLQ